jgi:hypothetical protein
MLRGRWLSGGPPCQKFAWDGEFFSASVGAPSGFAAKCVADHLRDEPMGHP